MEKGGKLRGETFHVAAMCRKGQECGGTGKFLAKNNPKHNLMKGKRMRHGLGHGRNEAPIRFGYF